MAAPQQHALTNTSCTFPASHAVFSTSGNYGGGQSASCNDLHDQLSGINNCDIEGVVYSSTAVVSQPILGNAASRKTKPCSLCGTAAQRSQACVVPNSPISPQEQPVVLLHRLEDGLPEGDVDSLRAFGTIRLLPVHRRYDKAEIVADENKPECDRKYQSVESHNMSPGSLFYNSIKRGNVKKRTELSTRIDSVSDCSGTLTKESRRNYIGSDGHYPYIEAPYEKTEKVLKSANSIEPETDKSPITPTTKTKVENVVENSARKQNSGQKPTLAQVKAAPHHSLVSQESHSSHCLSHGQQWQPSSSLAEYLNRSATTRSPTTSNSSPSPQTSRSSTTAIHSYTRPAQSPCSTRDTVPHSASTSTPMSVVCSPVVQLPSTTLTSSPSQNISSPSAISPPESPPSIPNAFEPAFMGSPVTSNSETEHATCSVEVQPTSPYSPSTTPSLPASPTSLPSSSDSAPSPAPSLESPPASPVASSDNRKRISHNQALHPGAERCDDYLPSDPPVCGVESDTFLQSKVKVEHRKVRDKRAEFQCHPSQLSSMNNAEVPANKNSSDQHLVTPVPTASQTIQAPTSNTYTLEDTCAASQNRETKTQVDSFLETSSVENVVETEQLSQDLTKCLSKSESANVDLETSSSDYKSKLMKLVLKVKHHGSQQPQLGSEKKEFNKESGIPKIVLTLTGKGPNKEYSCSNRIRHDNENCSENLNNKKHKSKRNKRQKPKDREKPKRVVKGDKHKRHLELFGEDSNDSCDIDFDNSGEHPEEKRHSRTPSLDEQEINQSSELLSQGESVFIHSERDFPPSIPEGGSSLDNVKGEDEKIRVEENTESKDSSVDLVDESLFSLSQVKPDNLKANETPEDRVEDLPSVENEKEAPKVQSPSVENDVEVCVREVDEAPDTFDKGPPYTESESTEETIKTSASMLHSSDVGQPPKQPDDIILRSPKSRHAKNTESGRNSDACLWVSFGVNAPLPLPTADLPSLNRIFTSKEKTRVKERVSAESKKPFSTDESSISVAEKSVSKASHKDYKESEKIEVGCEVTTESRERIVEEKAKLSHAELNHKHDFSHSHHRSQSSSSHGGSHAHSRVRSRDDSVHHRHRHSHKRSRKSEESRERTFKKEESSGQQNSRPSHKEDDGNQVKNINTHKGKQPAFSTQMPNVEKTETSTSSTYPSISPSTDGDLLVRQDPTETHPQPPENAPNKESNNMDKPKHYNPEESPDSQYYRPKKIRKICHTSTTKEQWNEKKSLEPAKEEKARDFNTEIDAPNSYKNRDSLQYSVQTVPTPVELHATELEAPTAESDVSITQIGTHSKLQEDTTAATEQQPKSPRDAEAVYEHRKSKYRSPTPQEQEPVASTEEGPEKQIHPAAEKKEVIPKTVEDIATKDSLLENEESEKQEVEKKEKEKRRKSRREKRRDNSGR